MTENLEIRLLQAPTEHLQLQAAQEAIWGAGAAVVADQTIAACKFGGVALGAWDGDRLVGFCYGFPAYRAGETWLHSHCLGVLPEYRNRNLGASLKAAEIQEALRLGYRRMTWTYDPLEAPNARLNLGKLGGTVAEYLVDCYGPLPDDLNRGLPTDRFLLDLDLISPRGGYVPAATPPLINPAGADPDLTLTGSTLRLLIPPDFRQLFIAGARATVQRWRFQVRTAALHYFGAGYLVVGFHDGCYILQRKESLR